MRGAVGLTAQLTAWPIPGVRRALIAGQTANILLQNSGFVPNLVFDHQANMQGEEDDDGVAGEDVDGVSKPGEGFVVG